MNAMPSTLAKREISVTPRKWQMPQWMYMPAMIVLGIALPVLAYLLMMGHLGWRAPVFGDRGQYNAATATEGTVYLYASETNYSYYRSIGGNYEVLTKPWVAYFESRDRPYRKVGRLSDVVPNANSVVILPSALAISIEERNTFLRLQAAGVSFLSTWATGSRDANGEWMGWDFLQSLGVVGAGERQRVEGQRQMTISGETPLTLGMSAGQRVWLTPSAEPILRLRSEGTSSRLTDWMRNPGSEFDAEGAVVYSEARSSRSVAFAFAETSWDASQAAIYTLIDNSLSWLQRQPAVALANWPNGHRAAQLIGMDTEFGFPAATAFADFLKERQMPGTFFLLTSEAMKYPNIVQRLANDGFDLGYHGEVHDGFKGLPESDQTARLQMMRQQLTGISPAVVAKAIGFRAPTESYDQLTESLLPMFGVRYHLTDSSRSENTLPFLLKPSAKARSVAPLLIMPRTQHDDLNQLSQTQDAGALLTALVTDMDTNLHDGGLGTLSVHSQNMEAGMPLNTAFYGYLNQAAARQRSGALWIANGTQIDRWWRERSNVSVMGNRRGRRLELDITVKGELPVQGVTVAVMTPVRGTVPSVRVTKVGAIVPEVRRVDAYVSHLIFSSLSPGNYAYQLNFTKEN